MQRRAKRCLTIEDLKKRIQTRGGLYNTVVYSEKVLDDLSKVDVDCENCEYIGECRLPGIEGMEQFEVLNSGDEAFPIVWCACGGDWELPLAFVLYIDDKDRIRGYIPSDGNAYDHIRNCAYTNEDEGAGEPDFYAFNPERMREDVMRRIRPF